MRALTRRRIKVKTMTVMSREARIWRTRYACKVFTVGLSSAGGGQCATEKVAGGKEAWAGEARLAGESERYPGALVVRPDAEEVAVAAEEDLAVADGGGGEAFLAEVVLGEAARLGAGLEDVGDAFVGEEIDAPFGGDEGGVLGAEALGPEEVTGFGGEAVGDAGVRIKKEAVALDNRGGDVGDAAGGAPGDVGLGDLAVAVGADGEDVVVGEAAGDESRPQRSL